MPNEMNHAEVAERLESNVRVFSRHEGIMPDNVKSDLEAFKQAAADERRIVNKELVPMLAPQESNYSGLKVKYRVYHAEGNTPVEGDCFVLRPDKDPTAIMALEAYAIFTDNAQLSRDITEWLKRIERKDDSRAQEH